MSAQNARKRKRTSTDQHDAASEYSDSEEEFDFENIDLDNVAPRSSNNIEEDNKREPGSFTVALSSKEELDARKRYPTTAIARKIRFEIHKAHLLCLMSHVSLRNKWCSDAEIQAALGHIKAQFTGNLHPKVSSAQIQRTRVLLEGLEKLSDLWSNNFKIVRKGMSKPKWYTEEDLPKILASNTQFGDETTREDFKMAAINLKGDRDMGAQLLVALLRSMHMDARLVCSMQPLGLSAGKTNLATVIHTSTPLDPPQEDTDSSSKKETTRPQAHKLTKPKLGMPKPRPVSRPKPQVKHVVPVVECPYPIYWAEVFDQAAQKWYPVDPLVTGSVNKPAKFEPPQSESENTLSYVVAFAEDGSARDVTHRYTKQFNAKVRRSRLDSIPSGHTWWKHLMKVYAPLRKSDRHLIEDAELAQKELAEGIPANVSDLKNHPLFVLERHLRKDEIIEPLRECGTIRIGKSQPPVVESVYPRKHLIKLRSTLAWYMRARQVRIGEQPKKTILKRNQAGAVDEDHDAQMAGYDAEDEGLFAESQTEAYLPFPVVDGIVPKNAFGNIDLFLPAMLPLGAVHFPRREAEAAARLLGVDYAVAVTGFDHANRMTVPVKQGVVVAEEYAEAMAAVQEALLDEALEGVQRTRTLAALKRWSHFLRAMRVREHVQNRYGDGTEADAVPESDAGHREAGDGEEDGDQAEHVDTGGGFM